MPAVNEKRGLGLILAILGVFALYAVALAPAAKATEVLPADPKDQTVATAELKDRQFSWFIPNNGYHDQAVGCEVATASFGISPSQLDEDNGYFSFNQNQKGIGTFSSGSGGVIGNLKEPPTFDDCEVYEVEQNVQEYTTNDPPDIATGATVTTKGEWTVTGHAVPSTDGGVVAIAVPPRGAQIRIQIPFVTDCFLSVTEDKPQAATADFIDGDATTPGELLVDTQLLFVEDPTVSSNCSLLDFWVTSPTKRGHAFAQYEADYDVTADGEGVRISR